MLAACGHRGFATTTALPDEERRPNPPISEQEPARPEPRARPAVSPVVSVASNEVERVVRTYLLAVVREDLGTLESLLADEARVAGRVGGRPSLLDTWRARMRATDAARALAPPTARIREMSVVDSGTEAKAAQAQPGATASGDLLVRVPITRTPGDPRFGDVLVLVLRREHGELRIVTQTDES